MSKSNDSGGYFLWLLSLGLTGCQDFGKKGSPESCFHPDCPYFRAEWKFQKNSGPNLQPSLFAHLTRVLWKKAQKLVEWQLIKVVERSLTKPHHWHGIRVENVLDCRHDAWILDILCSNVNCIHVKLWLFLITTFWCKITCQLKIIKHLK